REMECHSSPGTRKNAQGRACRARACCARRVSLRFDRSDLFRASDFLRLIASRALLLSVGVVRFRIWAALAVGAIVAGFLCAQVSEEQKGSRDETTQSETQATPSPRPKKSPSPGANRATSKSTKKHRASPTPDETVTAIPKKLASEGEKTS